MMLNKGGDDDAKKSGAKEQLAENLQEQSKLKKQVKDLSDEAKSDRQIAASVALVSNETESPAMGHMLGAMWKDMRMLDTPLYIERVQDQIQDLQHKQRALEKKVGNGGKKAELKEKKSDAGSGDK